MGLLRIQVKDAIHMENVLQTHSSSGRLFVLFFGEGGWCPDCEEAHPHIENALAAVDKEGVETVFAEVPLARASYSVSANPDNANHWARVHPLFQLKKIPTLYRINKAGNKKIGELVEGDAAKDDLLEELLQ